MNVAFFIIMFSTILLSCAGDVPNEQSPVTVQNVETQQEENINNTGSFKNPPAKDNVEDDNPCGYEDFVLEDPTNKLNSVVITLQIPCSPYYVDEGRPLPIIKQ